MKVTFWGVRGSIPSPGMMTAGVGGNTSCVSVETDDGTLIIFDAGTGIRQLGVELMKHGFGRGGREGHNFFSHTHWDHIQGFPFFMPAFIGAKDEQQRRIPERTNTFYLYGAKKVFERLENTLRGQMEYQYFPIGLDSMGANIHFHELQESPLRIGSNSIIPQHLNHPNGVLSYRLECGESSRKIVAYATDTEHYRDGELDVNVLKIAENADVFIYDAMYTPQEYDGNPENNPLFFKAPRYGWGHSTWLEGTRLAKVANAKELVLFHHDPEHSDEFLREIERQAQQEFPRTRLAVEGLEILL